MPIHFNNSQTIYLQIANYLHEQILLKKIEAGGKLPAIRQLATRLKVNPNTIQRTYHLLARQAVIVRKRGIGYFLTNEGLERVTKLRRAQFLTTELPIFFRHLYMLGITFDEIRQHRLSIWKVGVNKRRYPLAHFI